jgi:hypothetical protein
LEQSYFDNALVETATKTAQSQWLPARVSLGKENLGRQAVILFDSDRAGNDFDGLLGFANLGFHRVTFDFEHGLLRWD